MGFVVPARTFYREDAPRWGAALRLAVFPLLLLLRAFPRPACSSHRRLSRPRCCEPLQHI